MFKFIILKFIFWEFVLIIFVFVVVFLLFSVKKIVEFKIFEDFIDVNIVK